MLGGLSWKYLVFKLAVSRFKTGNESFGHRIRSWWISIFHGQKVKYFKNFLKYQNVCLFSYGVDVHGIDLSTNMNASSLEYRLLLSFCNKTKLIKMLMPGVRWSLRLNTESTFMSRMQIRWAFQKTFMMQFTGMGIFLELFYV